MAVSIGYGLIYLGIAKLVFQADSDRATGLLFQMGWLATILAFFCYFWMKAGQTTGMRAWRLKLTTQQGDLPNLYQCFIRLIVSPFGWLLCFTLFFDKNRQCLHDRLSGTCLRLIG